MRFADGAVAALDFGDDTVALGADDASFSPCRPTLPPSLVHGLEAPTEFRAIVNAHFRIEPPPDAAAILGVLNGTVQWMFAFPGRLSITISAGDRLIDAPREELAATIWGEVARVTGLSAVAAALADRARAPRHLRRDAGAGRQTSGRADPMAQSRPCRRLDRYRLARYHRRRDPFRQSCRRPHRETAMIDDTLEQRAHAGSDTACRCNANIRAASRIPSSTHRGGDAGSARAASGPDGHWVFELEADATIPAEYVLLRHYLGEPVDAALEAQDRGLSAPHPGRSRRLAAVPATAHLDMSATVKAYFALKMIGDSVDADHMRRAREAVRARGGAERANVFTRIMLALFGFIPWRAVPVMPVEIMLLPKWFPFHLDKISYWSRTVIVPLLVLMAKKPRARNAKGVRIDELFLAPPQSIGPTPKAPQQKASWFWFFRGVDNVLRATEPYFPQALAPARHRPRRRLDDRAPQRRGRRSARSSRPWPTA